MSNQDSDADIISQSPSTSKRSRSSASSTEVQERKQSLINQIGESASQFHTADSKIIKIAQQLAFECPDLKIWAEKAPDHLVERIERLCGSKVTHAEAVSIASFFLDSSKKGLRRSSPTFSNELLQNHSHFSYQSKGAAALRSPIDPNLPSSPCEPFPWAEDEVILKNTPREATLQALLKNAKLSGCPFELRVTGEKPTIGSFKPDVVLIQKGRSLSDHASFGALLNVKSTTDGNYDSAESVGKVIIYGQEFLRLAGPARDSIVVGVTDLEMITLFRVSRADDAMPLSYMNGFTVHRSEPSPNVLQVLSACLQADPASLNVKPNASWQSLGPEAAGWKRSRFLGSGLTSHVFQVVQENSSKQYALKTAREGFTLDNDIKVLRELAGIDGIPKIHTVCSPSTLILEPVGEPFTRDNFSHLYPPPKLSKLVDTLKAAHSRNIVNRDLRIENLMIARSHEDDRMRLFLLDWGFAATSGVTADLSGSLITASDSVLKQHIEHRPNFSYTFADDLVSLVRCLFLFYRQRAASNLYRDPKKPQQVLNFWESAMTPEWQAAGNRALHLDYSNVGKFFDRVQDISD